MKKIYIICGIGIALSVLVIGIVHLCLLPAYQSTFIWSEWITVGVFVARPLLWSFIGVLLAAVLLRNVKLPSPLKYLAVAGIAVIAALLVISVTDFGQNSPALYRTIIVLTNNTWVFGICGLLTGAGVSAMKRE